MRRGRDLVSYSAFIQKLSIPNEKSTAMWSGTEIPFRPATATKKRNHRNLGAREAEREASEAILYLDTLTSPPAAAAAAAAAAGPSNQHKSQGELHRRLQADTQKRLDLHATELWEQQAQQLHQREGGGETPRAGRGGTEPTEASRSGLGELLKAQEALEETRKQEAREAKASEQKEQATLKKKKENEYEKHIAEILEKFKDPTESIRTLRNELRDLQRDSDDDVGHHPWSRKAILLYKKTLNDQETQVRRSEREERRKRRVTASAQDPGTLRGGVAGPEADTVQREHRYPGAAGRPGLLPSVDLGDNPALVQDGPWLPGSGGAASEAPSMPANPNGTFGAGFNDWRYGAGLDAAIQRHPMSRVQSSPGMINQVELRPAGSSPRAVPSIIRTQSSAAAIGRSGYRFAAGDGGRASSSIPEQSEFGHALGSAAEGTPLSIPGNLGHPFKVGKPTYRSASERAWFGQGHNPRPVHGSLPITTGYIPGDMVQNSAPHTASFPGVVTTGQTDLSRLAARNPRAAVSSKRGKERSGLAAVASTRRDVDKSIAAAERRPRRPAAEEGGMPGHNPAVGQSDCSGGAAADSISSHMVGSRPQTQTPTPTNTDADWIAFCRSLAESPRG